MECREPERSGDSLPEAAGRANNVRQTDGLKRRPQGAGVEGRRLHQPKYEVGPRWRRWWPPIWWRIWLLRSRLSRAAPNASRCLSHSARLLSSAREARGGDGPPPLRESNGRADGPSSAAQKRRLEDQPPYPTTSLLGARVWRSLLARNPRTEIWPTEHTENTE
jgi:hypothetical protein